MQVKHVYQDPITGQKFTFDRKYPRSNPDNNVSLIYLGEEGTAAAGRDVRHLTFDELQRMIIASATAADIEAVGHIEIPKDMLTDEQIVKLNQLMARRKEDLVKKDNDAEQKVKQEAREKETKIVDGVVMKIRGARTIDELARIHEPGRAIEGVGQEVAVKADEAYRARFAEINK